MPDARVARTRQHVLETTRRLLADHAGEPITFSSIAKAAQVARKTLYVHWSSVAHLISDLLLTEHEAEPPPAEGLPRPERLSAFATGVRDAFQDPATRAAMAYLVNAATSDPVAAEALTRLTLIRTRQLAAQTGTEPDPERLAALVGPLLFSQMIAGVPASDDFIAHLVEREG
jgi:AcrR family transcriptional regulator